MKRTTLSLLALALAAPIATVSPAAAEHHEAALTTQLPLETLMTDDSARAVVLKHLPGIDEHPAYGQFKAISLRALVTYAQGAYTEDTLDLIDAELAAH
mgnify:CR=1 FL=1